MIIHEDILKAALLATRRPTSNQHDIYYNTASYLARRKQDCELSRKELLIKSGYANENKFHRLLDNFPNLNKRVPKLFLELFDVNYDTLNFCVELDLALYDEALAEVKVPSHFVVRYMACVYGRRPIPAGLSEEDAINYVIQFASQNNLKCCIDFSGLKSVWIENGKSFTTFSRPAIVVRENTVCFTKHAQGGTVRIR